jgi:hypothetical protein
VAEINEFGVDTDAITVGANIRLVGLDGTASGVVDRLDGHRMGVFRLHDQLGHDTGEKALFHAFNVCGLGLVCDRTGPLPAPSWALDFIDFPTGWHVQRQGVIHTDRRCSAVQAWGGFLCDCGAIEAEWKRRRTLMGRPS